METLKIGIIGYGVRAKYLLPSMETLGLPFRISAVTDVGAEELKKTDDPYLENCDLFTNPDEMLQKGEMDGIMISTNCPTHTPMACKAIKRQLPIFLEKPVAVNFQQIEQLTNAFKDYKPPVIVSFPLRLSSLISRVKKLLEADEIGTIEHMVAFNDVPYGRVYYNDWYRDYDKTGGLFLQKATHDFDALNYLLGQDPATICAMNSRRIYGGDRPHNLRCRNCDDVMSCPEGTFKLSTEACEYPNVDWQREDDWCVFSKEIKNEDSGNAIIEYRNGVQASYTQNFFVRHKAGRRGARLYGYKGTIEYDWYQQTISVYNHRGPWVTRMSLDVEQERHFGGDHELCLDFFMAMAESRPSRSPIRAGIVSASMCLSARESAEKRQFCSIKI